MSDSTPFEVGAVAWVDLTVENAEGVRHFYSEVVGWKSQPVNMGGYNDYNMLVPKTGKPAVGVCHARGVNAALPPQWLIYIVVKDLDISLERCRALGGKVLVGPKRFPEHARFCVIEDPAGAVVALYEKKSAAD